MDSLFTLRWLDVVDILIVAYLMYQIYMLIKGTVAINIFIGIFSIYLVWLIVKALNMQLLGSILGQVISVGVIALIIVFQQEVRRFLLMLGSRYLSHSLEKVLNLNIDEAPNVKIKHVVRACTFLSDHKVGALIIISRKSSLSLYSETGDILNAETSSRLLESIFNKNSPLHDGAVIIKNDKIHAARCILPVSENPDLPANYGLRHRAALGLTEHTDALAIIISEESGSISIADSGRIEHDLSRESLTQFLEKEFQQSIYQAN
jgi:diadenylate cyclase